MRGGTLSADSAISNDPYNAVQRIVDLVLQREHGVPHAGQPANARGLGLRLPARTPARQTSLGDHDARASLVDGEGTREVIVGAGVQRFLEARRALARDDGDDETLIARPAANATRELESVDLRGRPFRDDHVGGIGLEHRPAVGAVGGRAHDVAHRPQRRGQEGSRGGVVIGDDDSELT